jgi:tape measure domain-containing protein
VTNETSRLTLAVDSRQVRTAASDLDRFSAAGRKTETATQGVARSFVGLRGALGGVSAALAARAIIQSADAYSNLNARLRLVTKSATEFAAAQKGVFDIAQGTRTGLTETADLFGSLSRATEELGVSQDAVLGVTETINQALQVSGTSAQGAAAALVQLGQGFSAGALRGEELNSVLEQAPRLARAIADGLGVPIGKLRELGAAGELTAEKVFKALEGSAEQLQREFNGLPLTVGAATTQASNSLIKLIGALDETTGASGGLASAIGGVAGFIGDLADEIGRLNSGGLIDLSTGVGLIAANVTIATTAVKVFAANVSFTLGGIGREFAAIFAQIGLVAEVLATPPGDLIATARRNWRAFNAISEAVKEDGVRARRELDQLQDQLTGQLNRNLGRTNEGAIGSENDPRRGRGFSGATPRPPRGGGGGGGTQRETISEADRYLENLRQQLQKTRDLSIAETVLADIQAGRLGKVSASQEAALLSVAAQIDGANRLASQLEAEQRQLEDYTSARKELAEEGRRIFEGTRTPAEQLASQLSRLNTLLQEGSIDWDTYSRATFDAQDAFDQTTQNAAEATKEVKSVAQELGFTFSSAFENAIVGGNKLRDVIKGLGQDILRILVRNNITNPLSQAIGSFNFGSLFSGATPLATGMSYVPFDNFPALLHQGERVVPAARNRGSSGAMKLEIINPPGRRLEGSASTQQSPTGDILRIVLREVANDVAGGGQVSKAMQRTYGLNRSSGAPRNG